MRIVPFKKLFVKIEQLPFINWFNPLMTLYVNFRSFPFSQACKLPVFVYGWPRIYSLYGSMECVEICKPGMIVLNQTRTAMPNHPGISTAINNWGKIYFHGKCKIYTFNKINVLKNGILDLGEDVKIMAMVNITVFKSVHIGSHSRVVHRCQVMDSNFHYIADFNKLQVKKIYKPVFIGDYCWICNSSTIAAGAKIPNKTIVASNSLVNKDMSKVPEESIIGGIPAKLVSTGYRKIESEKLIKEVTRYFKANPELSSFSLPEAVNHNCCDID